MSARGKIVRLAKPLERAIADGHPWVYRAALRGEPTLPAGTVLDVHDRRDRFLARGLAETGPIALRVFGLTRLSIDRALFDRRLATALELRHLLAVPETTAIRWVHGEGDRLPGLVCDRYGDVVIVAFDGEAIAAHRESAIAAVIDLAGHHGVRAVAVKRGRGAQKQLETVVGDIAPGPFPVRERGMVMLVDVHLGQKTGLFLDHRDSRAWVRARARGRSVLNLYGYTGGFSIAAGLGGARRVTTVDQSAPALELAQASWGLNGLAADSHQTVAGDVREFLDATGSGGDAQYDLVVCDPPSFAPNQRSREAALTAYRQLHGAAIGRVTPGGLLLAASCSAHVDRSAFEDTLRAGARQAKRHLQVLGRWGAGADHPVPLGFPEGNYLKVTLCRATAR
ncbi:MAG: class I SAM-dependent rRNA methyltransferase [Myxococcales bacterium FL481]|nr:MAG: class I SAM-dependent rRNA methyltransferase [Myxococcales bacterium FL481]